MTWRLTNGWAARGITGKAIAPSLVEANSTAALRAGPEGGRAILDRVPAGRWGQPGNINRAAIFLAAEAARCVHGATLNVDGGWLAR
ncbi:MAG: SDR family oxidoreductase [Alkalilacustris sp.]